MVKGMLAVGVRCIQIYCSNSSSSSHYVYNVLSYLLTCLLSDADAKELGREKREENWEKLKWERED